MSVEEARAALLLAQIEAAAALVAAVATLVVAEADQGHDS